MQNTALKMASRLPTNNKINSLTSQIIEGNSQQILQQADMQDTIGWEVKMTSKMAMKENQPQMRTMKP